MRLPCKNMASSGLHSFQPFVIRRRRRPHRCNVTGYVCVCVCV